MIIDWDTIVGFSILIGFILVIWAKISNQTIGDVMKDIKEIFTDRTEEIQEKAEEVIVYE